MYYINLFLPFLFILGSAVILHEFGHFIVAKLLGMRVETFSFGFGPRLFGHKWGPTDYRVSLVPLGGYVKLGGDESNAPIEGGGEENVPEAERFDLRPRWQKFLVMIAGPVMNILTALAIPFIAALMYGIAPAPAPVVSQLKQGGAAEVAGLKAGDRIVAINGAKNPTWDRIYGDAYLSPERPLPLTIERDGQQIQIAIKPAKRVQKGEVGGDLEFTPDFGVVPVLVDGVEAGAPAAEAGLQPGDRLLAVNGEPVRDPTQMTDFIQQHKSEPLHLTVARGGGGERVELTAQTRLLSDGTERLGFKPRSDETLEKVGAPAAFSYAVNRNLEILRITGKAFGQIFSGQRAARDTLAGPIGIARMSAQVANEAGWAGIFGMLGFLSLSLGIFNLLPIPVLDGGAIFILFLEATLGVIGLTLSMAVRERIQQVGFVLIMLLMIFVISNDLLKLVSQWRTAPADRPAASAPK